LADCIFLINDDQTLFEMFSTSYDSEDLLQKLLADYPQILTGEQINSQVPRRWLLIDREIGIPAEENGNNRWSLDHLFLDQEGISHYDTAFHTMPISVVHSTCNDGGESGQGATEADIAGFMIVTVTGMSIDHAHCARER